MEQSKIVDTLETYQQDVQPCPAIDEGPGDHHVADDWGTKHWEDSGRCCALELIR